MMNDARFYEGFEGHPATEFAIRRKGAVGATMTIWTGYFDSILDAIQPVDGCWTGLALPYHLCEGWLSSSPWKVEDLDAVYMQWIDIDVKGLPMDYQKVHAKIADFIAEVKRSDSELWISAL